MCRLKNKPVRVTDIKRKLAGKIAGKFVATAWKRTHHIQVCCCM